MPIPLRYTTRNLVVRWRTHVLTVLAMSLVVAVFVSMLSLAQGLTHAFATSGDPRNVVVLRRGATAETNSGITREYLDPLRYLEGVQRGEGDVPIHSPEAINLMNLPKVGGGSTNVIIRGVGPMGASLRPTFRIVEGRAPRTGVRELVVGEGAAARLEGVSIGATLRLAKSDWTIVGRFSTDGSAADSEIWGDVDELISEFNREVYSSVLLRTTGPDAAAALVERIDKDQQLKSVFGQSEVAYYAAQTKSAGPIKFLGYLLAIIMAVGAIFAAMNTMYAAISARTREVATLRVLGYRRRSILAAFLVESVLLAIVGGVLGGLLALPMNGLATGTTNFDSFSEVTFQFRVTPSLLLGGIVFASFMGLMGGLLPSLQASRRSIIDALRDAA